ncbi:MAG: membrane integrity-associated transporter subunit PqiC [Marinospirillum sp.]|uniref:ABC-type transport auxiliary lipoprotein family protein n=1 Tax=Marinospirillum sp. TaxID=2183934 RepID=UPI001A012589|nr:ABC-type transport auxiliary lipoprotein family protein [Marinospirillum sp.]MBE0507763.1 membrane integrity-associated transporter subunit PqiC [Marinospirillum sp.]
MLKQARRFFPLALLLISGWMLSGCLVTFPQATQAPQPLLLSSLKGPDQIRELPSGKTLHLAVERPMASAPLRSRELWYRESGHRLTPFSKHLWAESLDLQVQQLLTEALGQQLWIQASLADLPGYRADYRIRLTLNQWYLQMENQSLQISLQLNLLDATGRNLLQQQWSAEQPVRTLSPGGMATASQQWLEQWSEEVSQLLYDHLKDLDPDQ